MRKSRKRQIAILLSAILALSMVLTIPVFSVESAAATNIFKDIPITLAVRDGNGYKEIKQGKASFKLKSLTYNSFGTKYDNDYDVFSQGGGSKEDLGPAARDGLTIDKGYPYAQSYQVYMSGILSDTYPNETGVTTGYLTVPVPAGYTGVGAKRLFSWGKNSEATENYTKVDVTVNSDGTITIPMEIGFGCWTDTDGTTYHNTEGVCIVEYMEAASVPVTGITMKKTAVSVYENNTVTLKAVVAPTDATDKTITWKSKNTKIATVSAKGVVKGISAGETIITATTKDGGFKAKCKVTVKAPIKATAVKVSPTKATMTKGETLALRSKVTPTNTTNKTLKWTTSDKTVATVDQNGVVTAKKKGTAVITATTTDGSKKKATCNITVKNPEKVKKITFEKDKVTIKKGKTATLKVTITPENAVNKELKWTSADKSIVTVNKNGKIKGIKKGTTYIKVQTTDGTVKAKCKVTVK